MTKPLNTQLSEQDGPAPRSGSRTRAWLVALLGFGAADLLVLNLWAVPNLFSPAATTTDIRAAQSGDQQPAVEPQLQPMAAVAVPEQPAEIAQPEAAPTEGAQAEPPVEAAEAVPAEAEAEDRAEPPAKPEPELAHAAPAPQPRAARSILHQPPPEPEAAPQPAQPPAGLAAEAYAPTDTNASSAFAIRAAQRAVQLALVDRAASSGSSPFQGLSESDQPLTQIFFSMGNFMLGPNGKQVLERMLPQLTGDQRPILIVGSADPSGSEQINEKLSDARAQSVAEWMLVHGVDAARIQTRAIGHEGAVGSTLDRRVDIWLGGSR